MSRLATLTSLLLLTAVATAQPRKGEDESAALVEEGRAALKKNKLDEAAKALDQAIALNPRRIEAYVLRSAVYAARKEYKDGVALLRKAQALDVNDNDVNDALGTQLVFAGSVDEGIALLQQVVAKDAARYDAQLVLGHHWHDGGKWADSIAALEAYFAHRPKALEGEDSTHKIDLADSYLRSRQPQKALELFEQAAAGKKQDLRARIGVAWATAAIDCRKARPILKDLEPVAEQHPEVLLVDGQCALALGDTASALARGKRFLEKMATTGDKTPAASAATAHALVGEADAAKGDLSGAIEELGKAQELEPNRRRWSVRLAIVLRRANKAQQALATLDKVGPPDKAASEPEWWTEVGESLLATNDAKGCATRLQPVLADLPDSALVRVLYGQALLSSGQAADAVKPLDEAEKLASSARGKKLLSEALVTVAAGKLAANDSAAALPMLERAEQLDATPVVLRDYGIALMAESKFKDAAGVLDRAIKVDTSGIALMLDARAHAQAGEVAAARAIYEKAVAADKDHAAEIAVDWAASELSGGDPNVAVAALEKTVPKTGAFVAKHKAALAEARHAAGLAALRQGNGDRAVALLRQAVAVDNAISTKCDLAVATVVSGDVNSALAALKAVGGQSCPFPPPADTQAAPILAAFVEGIDPRRAAKALDRLQSLGGRSTGISAVLLATSTRVLALNAAQDAYRNGQTAQAKKFLATAKNANARVGADEVAHNLAVIDLNDGNVDAAIAELEKLTGRVPEALINVGIAYEKKGDHAKALDAWKRAKKAGVRYAPLDAWIESKQRVWGETP